MSRRKQAKPRSLKGQEGEINTKEDSMIVGKKRCSWERRKEKEEERERIEKEKNEDAKEHKCAILQQSESFIQQRVKYCRNTDRLKGRKTSRAGIGNFGPGGPVSCRV